MFKMSLFSYAVVGGPAFKKEIAQCPCKSDFSKISALQSLSSYYLGLVAVRSCYCGLIIELLAAGKQVYYPNPSLQEFGVWIQFESTRCLAVWWKAVDN